MKGTSLKIRKKLAAGIAAVAVASAFVVPAAMAVINEGGDIDAPGFVGVKVYGGPDNENGWAGEMGSFAIGTMRVFCIEKGVEYPTALSDPQTPQRNPLAAYVLNKYNNTTDDITAAAVYYILGQDAGLQVGDSAGQRETLARAEHRAEIEAVRQRILAEAQTDNNVDMSMSLRMEIDRDERSGTAFVDTTGETGPIVLTLSGPAVFSNGSNTITVTPVNGQASAPITSTGNGLIRISGETASALRSDDIIIYNNGDKQSAVRIGAPEKLAAADPNAYRVRNTYEPTIVTTSSVNTGEVKAGQTVTDTIKVTGGEPNGSMDILSRLYGPMANKPAQTPNAPSGTTLVNEETVTITLDASGNGEVTTSAVMAATSGWYSYDTDFAGNDMNEPFDAGFGVDEETGNVSTWQPTATTRTSQQLVGKATELTDTVDVSDGLPGATFEGTTTLYGPFASDPSQGEGADLSKAPKVGVSTFTGTYGPDGKASVVSTPQTTKGAGYYVWAEVINPVPGVSEKWEQEEAKPTETTVEINPTVATQVNDQQVLPGHTLTDKVLVTGIVNSVGDKEVKNFVSGTLYGPVAPKTIESVEASTSGTSSLNTIKDEETGEWKNVPTAQTCEAVDWTDAPIAAVLDKVEVKADEQGNATLDAYGEFKLPDTDESLGCYSYAETLTSVVDGEEPVVVEHEVGDEAQTSIALKPGLSTQVSNAMVTPGAELTDDVLVWGTGGTKFAFDAKLFGMADPGENRNSSALTDGVWRRMIAEKTVSEIGTETVEADKGDALYTTKPVKLPDNATGYATWYEEARFEGSESSEIKTPYGVETETSVALSPKVTTLAHHEYDYAGSNFTDKIWVSGTYGNSGVITGKVLGPIAGNKVGDTYTCDALDWSKAPVAGEIEPISIQGDGEFESSSIKTTTKGCYTFVETLTMDGNKDIVVNTKPGEATETNYFGDKPETPKPETPKGEVDNGGGDQGVADDSGDGGGVDAGDPSTGAANAGLAIGGVMAIAAAAAIGGRTLIRRTSK